MYWQLRSSETLPSVTGNICSTLSMTTAPEHEIVAYLNPTPRPYIFFLVSRSIWWYVGHDRTGWSRSLWNRRYYNTLKTVEIPTPKLHIFLFLVSGNIWWCVGHDHTGWFHPLKQKVPEYLKNSWDPYPLIKDILVSCVEEHLIVYWSWPYGVVLYIPLKQEVP
jgi:hypothetical protein